MTLTLNTSKRGVVTLPKELLEHIGVQPGEEMELTLLPDRQIGFKAARPKGRIEDLFSCKAGETDVRLKIDELDEATGRG